MKRKRKKSFKIFHWKLPIALISLFGIVIAYQNPNWFTVGAQSSSFSFTAAGDIGANTTTDAGLSQLDQSGSAFFLALGDLDYNETPTDEDWCVYVKSRLPTLGETFPFELVTGNHEEQIGPDIEGYILNHAACLPDRLNSTLGPGGYYGVNYYFDYPTLTPLMRTIMISADLTVEGVKYDFASGSVEYNWLASAIDSARAAGIPWVTVGMHKPCLSTGTKTGCSIGQDLTNLLVNKKVDLVLQGHEHNFERSKQLALNATTCVTIPDNDSYNENCVVDDGSDGSYSKGAGTVFVISGSFGRGPTSINPLSGDYPYFAKVDDTSNGFGKYTVSESQINYQFVHSTGAFTDSFTINQAGGPSPSPTPSPEPSPTATPSPSPTVTTIKGTLLADATIVQASPNNNYGSSSSLQTDASPVEQFLVKFNVSGIGAKQIQDAKIRLYNVNDSSGTGGTFYKTLDTSWSESTVNWNNAPATDTLLASLGPVSLNQWYEVNVTSAILGDGDVGFRVTSTSTNGAGYSSKQGTAVNRPELVITIVDPSGGGLPSPSPVPSPSPTPSPSPSPSPAPSPTPSPSPAPVPSPSPSPSPSPTPTELITILASDDATLELASPTANFGFSTKLLVDNSPVRHYLLKFPVAGVNGRQVTSAKLRLVNIDKSSKGGDFYLALHNNWTEGSVTWNTAPATNGGIIRSLGAVNGTVALPLLYEVDVTPGVTADGVISFRINSTSSNGADYYSRQGPADKIPQLVITVVK